jgi:ABC-type multidrug transport system fused ATPase/permease subunit
MVVIVVLVVFRQDYSPATAGLALTYCFLLPYHFFWATYDTILFATQLTSMERMLQYTNKQGGKSVDDQHHVVAQEEDWYCPTQSGLMNGFGGKDGGTSWPQRGEIVFRDVSMRYRPGLPLALQSVSFSIRGGETIGVCGRSGAGKSTVLALLFRLVPREMVSGSITIDGVDIMKIGLQRLRQSIAVIPQHPLLLEGTLAANLDPFGRHPTAKLLDVLLTVGFNEITSADSTDSHSGGGSSSSDGGNSSSDDAGMSVQLVEQLQRETGSLSAGQQQLISFARVLLKEEETRLVVMDEPTSNIDSVTDKHIQVCSSSSSSSSRSI